MWFATAKRTAASIKYLRTNSWPYRDYVIDELNRDLPYNEFVREQIAVDILQPGDRIKTAATGFLVAGPWVLTSVEKSEHKSRTFLRKNASKRGRLGRFQRTYFLENAHFQ